MLNKNIKVASWFEVPNVMALCKHYFAYLVYIKIWFYKALNFGSVLAELTSLREMSPFFQKFESSLEV